MRVLIIPEDFRKNQYILKPVIEAMLAEIGRPTAKVRVLHDPLLGGITEALKWSNIESIIDRYSGMIDLFLLIVDRDGVVSRRKQLDAIESRAIEIGARLAAENAWQEIEVWAIAAQTLPKSWKWKTIRQEVHPKEVFFEPLVTARNLVNEPGEGRLTLGAEAAKKYSRVRKLCPEDVGALEKRVVALMP